jgi:hypothetical protein
MDPGRDRDPIGTAAQLIAHAQRLAAQMAQTLDRTADAREELAVTFEKMATMPYVKDPDRYRQIAARLRAGTESLRRLAANERTLAGDQRDDPDASDECTPAPR